MPYHTSEYVVLRFIVYKYCVPLYHYDGARWYEQFLQVGRLDWALILLGFISQPPPYLWCS